MTGVRERRRNHSEIQVLTKQEFVDDIFKMEVKIQSVCLYVLIFKRYICIKCIYNAIKDVLTSEMMIYQPNLSLKGRQTKESGKKYHHYSYVVLCCVGEKALDRAQ